MAHGTPVSMRKVTMRRPISFLLALLATMLPAASGPVVRAQSTRPKVVVFLEPGFPAVDVDPPDAARLREALAGYDVVLAPRDELARQLTASEASRSTVFVNPYGSAFPKDAWSHLQAFLVAGGNWVNVGGA